MSTPGVVFTPAELAHLVADRLVRRTHGHPARGVLDPACGDGALLAALLERHDRDPGYARSALFGVERDPELAERARSRLRALAGLPRGTELDAHVVCGDALASDRAWPARTHVLANPPWVSFSGRRAAPRGERRAGEDGRDATAGWPSLHGAFLERVARHVAAERTLAQLILPAQVTELERYGPLRAAVTRWARLAEPPTELGEDRFAGVIGPAVVLALGPRPEGEAGAPGDRPDPAPWTAAGSHARELRGALEGFPRLPERTFADPGVHTGNCARELVFDAPGPGRRPLRVGRDLAAFRLGAASRYVRTDLVPDPAAGRRFRVAPLERYADFPVLVRQTADRPVAALHEPPAHFRNSLLAGRAPAGLDPAFVVGVLNGPVAAAWHRASWRDARQRAFPQVKVRHLASQPFPFVTRDAAPALHDELAACVRALASGSTDGAAFERAVERARDLALRAYGLDERARALVRALAS